jgi:SAM-dependent methyltransferase
VLRGWAARQFELAMQANLENIETALAGVEGGGALLDLGCDDGERTMRFVAAARAASASGAEVVEEQAEKARVRGIDARVCDLGESLPFDDASFHAVVSNQVIEHVPDTDRFVTEARRVLRPGGLAVVSTENLASWHNVAALTLGWQPFSLTNVSETGGGLGNPLAVHRAETPSGAGRSWQHQRVFAARGLRELFEGHGFRNVRVLGAGYFPFPPALGRLDPRHAAFITVTGRA